MNLLLHLHKDKLDSLGYDTVYLEKPISNIWENINWKKILLPPPKNNSDITRKEISYISKLTTTRSDQDISLIYMVDINMDQMFSNLLKSYRLNYPYADINNIYSLIRPILLNIKNYWNRPRPNQLAPYFNLKIDVLVTDTHQTAAYPSGHVAYGKLVSMFLKDMYPQIDTLKLDEIVNKISYARVIQGVHYPSDNAASLIFTKYLYTILRKKIYAR
jgi:hypothetical protein